jgi:flavodoxin I
MNKIAVIYWSSTGNTEAMANAIAVGAGADVYNVSDIDVDQALVYESIAFGCPSMGAEVLEEREFEPFFTAIESKLGGKKVALFGSYGWGDGEWMRDWEVRTKSTGATLFEEGLIINETPDVSGLDECVSFGKRFSSL